MQLGMQVWGVYLYFLRNYKCISFLYESAKWWLTVVTGIVDCCMSAALCDCSTFQDAWKVSSLDEMTENVNGQVKLIDG